EDVGNWQRGGAKEERARIPAISGNARERALHKLSAATKIRRGENGEREFLLHRGASDEEHAESIKYGYALQNSHSSWTPDYNVALRFASKYGNANKPAKHNVMSAWVPESQIHHIPKQLGSIPGGGPN